MGWLAESRRAPPRPPGVRLVIDARPVQEPERSPITAGYLDRLLRAFAAEPLEGESVVVILRALRSDPTPAWIDAGLDIAGRRWLPPTARPLRAAGMAVDTILLRGAQVRAGGGADDPDAMGAVFHTAGGAAPLRTGLPVVATLLDLAPWELPERYAQTAAARFANGVRRRGLRGAARVLVGSSATADAAERLLGLDRHRIVVVPLAAEDAFAPEAGAADRLEPLRRRLRLPARYLVVGGRWDARSDLPTLLDSVRGLRGAGATDGRPRLVLAGAAGHGSEGRTRVAALVEHHRVGDLVTLTPPLATNDLATLEAGAVGHVQPALADSTGLGAWQALAAGVPVVASRTGALPEVVGAAGIIVEPRDPGRLATAIDALWSDGPVARQVTRAARKRAAGPRRRWSDVARDTREAYVAALLENAAAEPFDDDAVG